MIPVVPPTSARPLWNPNDPAPREASAAIGAGAAVVGQDVDDAARGAAAVEGRGRAAQDLDAVDGGPVDVEEVGDEARRIVERDAVDDGLDAARAALGQDALAADGQVDPFAVGLVVDLDARDELEGFVDGDRPGHGLEERRLDDGRGGRILLERDLDRGAVTVISMLLIDAVGRRLLRLLRLSFNAFGGGFIGRGGVAVAGRRGERGDGQEDD